MTRAQERTAAVDLKDLKDLPGITANLPLKLTRFQVGHKPLLMMTVGQGGDYISDWISRDKLHLDYRMQKVSTEEAEKIAAVTGYDFSKGRMGNKEFVRIDDGRFLSLWDGTYTFYNFQHQKCQHCGYQFAYAYCSSCHRKQDED